MTPERYKQVDQLFQAALERPHQERSAFLDQVCLDDPELRREVEVLLSSDEKAGSLIESPAFELAPELMGNLQSTSLIGRAIGPYRVTAHLGSGGMGEVYLAEDSRLGRRVALKLLGRSLVGDAGSRARFLREARLASVLDHPNICTIFEVGESNGQCFIAMQYVEGKTLNRMLEGKPVGLDAMLSISLQVADALLAAHDRGIIHRDIKPSNIIVTERGQAKVLDFGLARAVEPEDGQLRDEFTRSGVVIGTPAYMSPEQARGMRVDARSDIFSLGVLMYELSTGHVPFKGKSQPETMNDLINQPHVSAAEVNKELPIDLSRVIDRSLAKNPADRYQRLDQVISDLSKAAENAGLLNSSASDPVRIRYAATRLVGPSSSGLRKTFLTVAAVSLLLAALAFVAYYFVTRPTKSKAASPFPELRLTRLTNSGRTMKAVISPDGKYFVHVIENAEGQSLWVRQVKVVTASHQIIPPRHVEYWGLTFSPDGNYVCCVVWESKNAVDVSLYQVPVLGGAAKRLPFQPISQISFSPDGKQIAFYTTRPPGTQLVIANLDETATREIVSLKQPNYFTAIHCSPEWSPDGKTIAAPFSTHDEIGLREAVLAVNPADGSQRIITHQKWAAVKNIAWLRDASGMLATVRETAASPAQVWHISFPDGGVRRISNDLNHYSGISLTADSRAFVTVQTSTVSSVWVASNGEGAGLSNDLKHFFGEGRFRQIASEVGEIPDIAWTREGSLVYVSGASGTGNIWAMGPDGSNPKQLTADAQAKDSLSVSPDGHYIVFASSRSGALNIWRADADGANLKQLTYGNGDLFPHFSPDSRWVVFQRGYGLVPTTLWKVSVEGGEAVQLTDTRVQKPRVSPEGEFVAYYYLGSDASGESEWSIGVVPFEGGQRVKSFAFPPMVSARLVRWMPNGDAIAYLDNRRGVSNIWGQPLNGNPPWQLTAFNTDQISSFDWSRGGRHLVVVRRAETKDAVLIEEVAH